MEMVLLYISAICWADLNNESVVTNIKDLQKSEYIKVPKDSFLSDGAHSDIEYVLEQKTQIKPWYYNVEYVCEI